MCVETKATARGSNGKREQIRGSMNERRSRNKEENNRSPNATDEPLMNINYFHDC